MASRVDAEESVKYLLDNAGYRTYYALPDSDTDPEAYSNPVLWIQGVGGTRVGADDIARVQVCALSEGRRESGKTAADALDVLTEGAPVYVPGVGLIDRIDVEAFPVEVNLQSGSFINHLFTVAVISRAL